MNQLTLIIAIVIAAILIYGIQLYNRLVMLKNTAKQEWANIDVLLKQRHDELPKLIDACQAGMGYEQSTLKQVVAARNNVMQASLQQDFPALGKAETDLRQGLAGLFALAENYPDLKTTYQFQQLQTRISGLETSIADRRELYNDSVNRNNIQVEQFPDVIVAHLLGFKHFSLLEFDGEEMADVDVGALLKRPL